MMLQAEPAFALIQARARLDALACYEIMGSPPEPDFDDIVALTSKLCETSVCTITLIDDQRQWFKARVGLDYAETPLIESVCALTLEDPGLLVIDDLSVDQRTRLHPAVAGGPHLRFYARMRLDTARGEALGTLCAMDFEPRPGGLRPHQAEALQVLGRQVVALLELRKAVRERDERTAALHASEARLRAIFETSYQFQGSLTAGGILLDANAHALAMIGQTLDQVVGRPFAETPWFVGTPGMTAEIDAAVKRATAGETVRREIELDLPDGRRVLDLSLRPVLDQRGAVLCIVPEGIDLTEHRRIEARLRQAEKMEAVGQLTGGIAHDFNNMLAIVVGFLGLARRRLQSPTDHSILTYIDNAEDGAARAIALTRRLLEFSRKQPLEPQPVDANASVRRVSELLSRSLSERIRFETVLADELWPIHVDAPQIENALVNLALNGRDAMPDGGILEIRTENLEIGHGGAGACGLPRARFVGIAVRDTGVGMAPSVVERAFEPFYTTKGVGEGTGLGLSQVFAFVRQSNGHVRIESRPGEGTTVRLYLPRYEGPMPAVAYKPIAAETGSPEGAVILVVEDEPQVRQMSVAALRELGHRVMEAASPAEAMRRLEADPDIALLFTDIVMPVMTGPQLAARAIAARPSLKVLFTTGCQHGRGLACETEDDAIILAKPFSIEELADKVRLALGAS